MVLHQSATPMSQCQHPLQIIIFTSSEVHFTSCELLVSDILHNFIYNKLLSFWFVSGTILGVEPKTSHALSKHSTSESQPSPLLRFYMNGIIPVYFLCALVLYLDVYKNTQCACLVLWRRGEEVGSPGTGVTSSCEPPRGSSGRATWALKLRQVSFLSTQADLLHLQSGSPALGRVLPTRHCGHSSVHSEIPQWQVRVGRFLNDSRCSTEFPTSRQSRKPQLQCSQNSFVSLQSWGRKS